MPPSSRSVNAGSSCMDYREKCCFAQSARRCTSCVCERLMRARVALIALLSVVGFACDPVASDEHAMTIEQPFVSDQTVLVDFAVNGSITNDTMDDASIRASIRAQLMYAVGQLNADRSVGRYERLIVSVNSVAPATEPTRWNVAYHATLPVAWGGKS